eukprot:7555632-Pyramimonas_sp.AAC.1
MSIADVVAAHVRDHSDRVLAEGPQRLELSWSKIGDAERTVLLELALLRATFHGPFGVRKAQQITVGDKTYDKSVKDLGLSTGAWRALR